VHSSVFDKVVCIEGHFYDMHGMRTHITCFLYGNAMLSNTFD
jgi:hypothetical protein